MGILAGIIAVALGAILVFFKFPHRDEEQRLLEEYREQDELFRAAQPRADGRAGSGATAELT